MAIEVVHAVRLARRGAGAGGVVDRVAGAAVLRAFRAGEGGDAVAGPAVGESLLEPVGVGLRAAVASAADPQRL